MKKYRHPNCSKETTEKEQLASLHAGNGYSGEEFSQLDKARQKYMKLRRESDMLLMDIFEHINSERYAGQIEQIKKDENGELDEIIIECGHAHLEKMAKNHWSLTIGDTVIGLISKNRIIISGL